MLLGTLLRNLLTSKGELRAGEGAIATTKGQGIIRVDRVFNAATSFNEFWNVKVSSEWTWM